MKPMGQKAEASDYDATHNSLKEGSHGTQSQRGICKTQDFLLYRTHSKATSPLRTIHFLGGHLKSGFFLVL